MYEPIELTLESPDGIVDIRLERNSSDTEISYSATILYPHTVGNIVQSKVHVHDIYLNPGGMYYFAEGTAIHPKIYLLEEQISAAIAHK